MNKDIFELVDVTLKQSPNGDGRDTALNLLRTGAKIGKLDEAVVLVCRRFCLRPLAVVEWFTANLGNMTAETKKQIEAMRKCESQKTLKR